jgi:hypothetical protein
MALKSGQIFGRGPQMWMVRWPHLRRPRSGNLKTQVHRQIHSRRAACRRLTSTACSRSMTPAAASAPSGKPSPEVLVANIRATVEYPVVESGVSNL